MDIITEFLKQKDRWVLWAPVAIAMGIGAYFSLNFEPNIWVGLAVTAIVALRITSLYGNFSRVLIWIPVLLFALGFTAAQFRTFQMSSPRLYKKTYPLQLQARVLEVEALPKSLHRVTLDNLTYKAKYSLPQKTMPTKIRIRLKKKSIVPKAGDIIKVDAMLLPLSSPVMPGAFDFQRHAFFMGIGSTGFAISNVEVIKEKPEGFFFPALRRYLRDNIKENIADADKAAIVIALLDGEDRDISEEKLKVIRSAGIAHLMAISGLQVALVTGFFFFLLRGLLASIPYIALRYPIKKITAFAAMCGAVFYMLLIGNSVSAERSVIMVCVVMLAIILDRDPFTLRLAAFAAAVMLLLQPEILFGASFQLSFAAVVALIAFFESTSEWWKFGYSNRRWWHKIAIYLMASIATTLVATIATAPFSLYHFLRSPLFPGIFANIVAVPLSSFVTIPFAILGSLLMPLGFEYYPLKVSEWSVEIILKTAEMVSGWPYAVFNLDYWPIWILVMMALGGLWICLWQGKIRWAGVVPILFGMIFVPLTPRADVLVSGSGELFAVRDANGVMWVSSKRKEKFVSNSWIESEAEQGHNFWNKEGAPLKCDSSACLCHHSTYTVSFVSRSEALAEDCLNSDIVIGDLYIDRKFCKKPKWVIDRNSLRKRGAHAIYFNPDGGFLVKSVADFRGWRPWVRY